MHTRSFAVAALALAAGTLAPALHAQQDSKPVRWKQHEMNRPRPERVAPVPQDLPAPVPADATVLFDGSGLSGWEKPGGGAAGWKVENGYMEVVPGAGPIQTKEQFGDVQLHVEWASPNPPVGTGQDRGNSGVFLMGRYEVQVLDSYNADTYPDGQAGALYGQYPPLFNATRAPGEWQAYDIFFRRPRFAADGSLLEPARFTVVHNGILIQNNEELEGLTTWLKTQPYTVHPDQGPLQLQDHGHPVRFRNIWAREIPARPQPDASYADRVVQLPAERLARFAGVYDRGGSPLRITHEGDHLLANFYGSRFLKLVPLSETEFALTETAGRVVFQLDRAGAPTGLVFHLGGAEMPARKVQ